MIEEISGLENCTELEELELRDNLLERIDHVNHLSELRLVHLGCSLFDSSASFFLNCLSVLFVSITRTHTRTHAQTLSLSLCLRVFACALVAGPLKRVGCVVQRDPEDQAHQPADQAGEAVSCQQQDQGHGAP